MPNTHVAAATRELAELCRTATDPGELLSAAVPLVIDITGSHSIVLHPSDDQPPLATEYTDEPAVLVAVPVPAALSAAGVTAASAAVLPGRAGRLEFSWHNPRPAQQQAAILCVALLSAALDRLTAHSDLTDLIARVDTAQQLANMGDYDWHIASDTNRWSDQLYRIYGHEPQTFNASYERFLEHIHPDDRDKITAIHSAAYASGEPYEMVERIVRPDGQLRYLASNGQVIRDGNGTPVRMRGTCIDITDRVLAEQAREASAARFRSLVEASPDAIVVYDDAGVILQANRHANELLHGNPAGRRISDVADISHPAGLALPATALDGAQLVLDIVSTPLSDLDGERLTAAFLRDAAPRLHAEAATVALNEANLRRRQALEVNDNVVQGLAAAAYALSLGDTAASTRFLDRTITAARHLMNNWLTPLGGDQIRPGDLVRDTASGLDLHQPPADTGASPTPPPTCRILVVDDNVDVRTLLRAQLDLVGRYDVIGEAGDGQQAIDQTRVLQPDIVLLDLAMPIMDGLQALPHILQASPGVQVIVLSGFDQASMAPTAMAAGAARYVEKGPRMQLDHIIDGVLRAAPAA